MATVVTITQSNSPVVTTTSALSAGGLASNAALAAEIATRAALAATLGSAATKNVGTTTGTVAAGDDSRIVNATTAAAAASAAAALIATQATTDSGTYARTGFPSYAPATLLNKYDAARNVYNLKAANTRHLRAGLGKAQAGTALTRHLFIGDSESIGYMGSGVYDQPHAWPLMYRTRLAAALGLTPAGTGMVRFANVNAGTGWQDARWTTTGAWQNGETFGYSTTPGATATFVSDIAGTVVEVAHYAGGNLTATIDGGAPATIDTSSPGLYTVTGLANTVHTVVITEGATAGYLIGACVRQTTGFLVDNIAQSSSTASLISGSHSWTDPGATSPYPTLGPMVGTPDCVWLALGVNDLVLGESVAGTVAALTTIAGYFPNSDVILTGQYQPTGITLAAWKVYIAALYTLADTLDVPLLDMFDRSGGYDIAYAHGLMGDGTHPDVSAHRDWAGVAAQVAAQ
jgi:hypothetical protein